MSGPAQLVVYAFAPGTQFEGWLVGALERLDVLGTHDVHDVLFVGSDPATGEPAIFDACGGDLRKMLVQLLDFRLDAAARSRATQQALAEDSGGVPTATLHEVAAALPTGGALVAILVEDGGETTFDDAAGRAGGTAQLRTPVQATRLADVPTDLVAAARR